MKAKLNINNPIDVQKIKKNLTEFTLVFDRHIPLIPINYRIRYIDKKTGDFGYGGMIMKHEKDTIMLRINAGFKPIIWKLKYNNYAIYVEDMEKKIIKRKQKNNLYKLYDAGLLKLID